MKRILLEKKNSHQVCHYSGSKESLYQIFQLLHYHIFWSCPLLISFWQEDYETLQKVLQVDIWFNLETLCFGAVPFENVTSHGGAAGRVRVRTKNQKYLSLIIGSYIINEMLGWKNYILY